jgi:hypothetical protein
MQSFPINTTPYQTDFFPFLPFTELSSYSSITPAETPGSSNDTIEPSLEQAPNSSVDPESLVEVQQFRALHRQQVRSFLGIRGNQSPKDYSPEQLQFFKTQPCRFFKKGDHCHFGDDCRYAHVSKHTRSNNYTRLLESNKIGGERLSSLFQKLFPRPKGYSKALIRHIVTKLKNDTHIGPDGLSPKYKLDQVLLYHRTQQERMAELHASHHSQARSSHE